MIRMKVDDVSNLHFERLNYHRHTYFDEYKVEMDGQFFQSTRAFVSAGLAKTTTQVRNRCCSINGKRGY